MPSPVDPGEAGRIAEAVLHLKLSHVVITSPTRDDLPDGGAAVYAATVSAIRVASPDTRVELLIPDFKASPECIERVVSSHPDIIGHNVETVPRLYHVRSGADYSLSLNVLRICGDLAHGTGIKSGIMLGLGEKIEEVIQVMKDLRTVGCRYLSIGQYLAPSRQHYPVQEFVHPEVFKSLRAEAVSLGFSHVESGPYVRSSYHAAEYK
jgi:lipoic acid synthetase